VVLVGTNLELLLISPPVVDKSESEELADNMYFDDSDVPY
jgi:hypothetical protein